MGVQLAFAFTAGLVSTVNPCGFAMLPAYLAYFIGSEGGTTDQGRPGVVLRGLLVGIVVSAGFLTVFGAAGLLLGAGLQALERVMPWLAMAVGVGVIVLGIALIRGFELTTRVPKVGGITAGRGLRNFYVFGLSYAVASLSCPSDLPDRGHRQPRPGRVRRRGGDGACLRCGHLAAGDRGHPRGAARQAVVRRPLRRSSHYTSRVAGAILALAGGYIIFFWVSVLSSGGLTGSPTISRFEQIQARLANALADAAMTIGIVLAVAVLTAVAYVIWSWRRRRRGDGLTSTHPSS